MPSRGGPDITQLVAAWTAGDESALRSLVSIAYPELRKIARQLTRPDNTMESAALVNEAYLKLIRSGGVRCEDRLHFFAVCAQMIRRILVDHARRKASSKRGGDAVCIPFEESLVGTRARGVEILALEESLESLAKIDSRKSRVVELRFFGGLDAEETAGVLGVSRETVQRDWKMAKAWLFRDLARAGTAP